MPQPSAGGQTSDTETNERIGIGISLGIAQLYCQPGVPPNSLGNPGDIYIRSDGAAAAAGARIYLKGTAGTWVATAA